ncbi:MAG: thiamine pyrophosphate-dependent enzyme [Candidatus Sungiibacteriota bacterium]
MNIDELKAIYRNCLISRHLDERLQEIYHAYVNKMAEWKTMIRFVNGAVGNELGQSAVAAFLKKEDALIPRYRGYAAVLGKGLAAERIAAEVLRKKTGTAKGLGDTSAFHDTELNICGHSTMLGSNFSVAIGLAFAKKFQNEPGIVVQFFGDGEASRTTFGVTLNLASLWQLPLLLVCENNGVSMHTSISEMSATATLAERAAGYRIAAETVYENKPLQLIERAKNIVTRVREDNQPFLLEIIQKRFVSHSSRYDTEPFFGANISKDEDPLVLFENELEKLGIQESELLTYKKNAARLVNEAILEAEAAEPLSREEFLSIYSE